MSKLLRNTQARVPSDSRATLEEAPEYTAAWYIIQCSGIHNLKLDRNTFLAKLKSATVVCSGRQSIVLIRDKGVESGET